MLAKNDVFFSAASFNFFEKRNPVVDQKKLICQYERTVQKIGHKNVKKT